MTWRYFYFILLATLTSADLDANARQISQSESFEVGQISGQFDVTSQGSATYRSAIIGPPGTAGLSPSISIAYSSQSPAGALGSGWSLEGIHVISRGSKNLDTDGKIARVNFTEDDALYLDGQRLIPVSVDASNGFTEFRTISDDGSRIRAFDYSAEGPNRFEIKTRDGLTLRFGSTSNSQIRLNDKILAWACDTIEDTLTNYVKFEYEQNYLSEFNIKRILYTGNKNQSVAPYAKYEFEYTENGNGKESYFVGYRMHKNKRLISIRTSFKDQLMYKYEFSYSAPTSQVDFVLDQITMVNGEGKLFKPTKFSYSNTTPNWQSNTDWANSVPSISQTNYLGHSSKVIDVNGDNFADFLYASIVNNELKSLTVLGSERGWVSNDTDDPASNYYPPIAFANEQGERRGVLILDINGDSLPDLLERSIFLDGRELKSGYLNENGSWNENEGIIPPIPIARDNYKDPGLIFSDVTGDGKMEILWSNEQYGTATGYILNGTTWEENATLAPPIPFEFNFDELKGAYLIDVDCDGKKELVYHKNDPNQNSATIIFKYDTKIGWQLVQNESFELPFEPAPHAAALNLVDINNDTYEDIIVSYKDNQKSVREIWLASKNGWIKSKSSPPFLLAEYENNTYIQSGIKYVHLDNDNLLDVVAHTKSVDGSTYNVAYLNKLDRWEKQESSRHLPNPIYLSENSTNLSYFEDVNGDSLTDVVYMNVTNEGPVAYVNNGTEWLPSNDFTPPVEIAKIREHDRGVRFSDLNGDGLTDIIVNRQGTDAASVSAYLNTGNSWARNEKYKPPVVLSGDKGEDVGSRLIDINSDGLADFIYAKKMASGQIESKIYPNSGIENVGWLPEVDSWPSDIAFVQENSGNLGTRVIDLNGDGRNDIITSQRSGANANDVFRKVYLNTTTGWVETPSFEPCYFIEQYDDFDYPVKICVDFVTKDLSGYPGSNSTAQRELTHKYRSLNVQVMDINGDRLPDLLFNYSLTFDEQTHKPINCELYEIPGGFGNDNIDCEAAKKEELFFAKHSGALINTGDGWSYSDEYKPKHELDDPKEAFYYSPKTQSNVFNDLNNDGLVDHIHIDHNNNLSRSYVYLNTGNGWTGNIGKWVVPEGVIVKRANNFGFSFIDMNGDSLLDILYSRKMTKDANPETGIHFNTGDGWGSKVDSFSPNLVLSNYVEGDPGTRILDVNGDGLPDLVQSYTNAENVNEKHVLLNNSGNSATGGRANVLIKIDEGMGQQINITYRSQTLNGGLKNDGQTIFYQPGERVKYPLINVTLPIHSVETVEIKEKINTILDPDNYKTTGLFEYSYEGFRLDILSGEPKSYERRTSLNRTSESEVKKTVTHFLQDKGRSGLTSKEIYSIRVGDNFKKLREVENSWERFDLAGVPNDVNKPFNYWVAHIVNAKSRTYDINYDSPLSIQTEEYLYQSNDDYKNVVKSIVTRSDGLISTTSNEYLDDDVSWIKGRLIKSIIQLEHSDPDKKTHLRTAEFVYSEKFGLLEQEITLSGSKHSLSTHHLYDHFGNTIQKITCPTPTANNRKQLATNVEGKSVFCGTSGMIDSSDTIEPRVISITFDDLGRLSKSASNSLNHTSSTLTFNQIFGKPTSSQSINGLITRTHFDGFGRVIKTISSTNVETTVERLYLPPNDRGAIYKVKSRVHNLPASEIWYDAKDRELRSISIGEDNREIVQDNFYDLDGRLIEKTVPRFLNDPIVSTRNYYDELGRSSKVIAANGQVGCYFYDKYKTSFVDFSNSTNFHNVKNDNFCATIQNNNIDVRKTVSEYDVDNNLISVKDALGGLVKYKLDVQGRVIEVNNNGNSIIKTKYDYAGNKSELFDPDLGHWKYEYNVYAEIVSQEDAKNQISLIEYDKLGRVIKKTTDDGILVNIYDDGDYAKGKLVGRRGTDGISEFYYYDKHTRLTTSSKSIKGKIFTSHNKYDELNRLTEITYPSGFIVKNHYDELGIFRCVTNAKLHNCLNDEMFWSGKYNALGKVISETYGNGIVTSTTHHLTNGLVSQIKVQDSTNNTILDESYFYDLGGNLDERINNGSSPTELKYEYDALDRLIKYFQNDTNVVSVEYDLAGNITNKTDVGAYNYGENGGPAHGVSSITNLKTHVLRYKYDANGNQTRNKDRKIEYNSSNQVLSVSSSFRKWSKFSYSLSGQKYFQDYGDNLSSVQTTYIGNYEEIEEIMVPPYLPTSERLRKRHYIVGGSGVVAAYEKIQWFYPTRHFPEFYQKTMLNANERSTTRTETISYFHKDYLGSMSIITDETGEVIDKVNFDPWGKRIVDESKQYHTFTKGFTGHEHIDNVGLIHMNGRVYDPEIGRFLSADPFIQFPEFGQSYNRYSYVLNNPLKFIDPTGYGLWEDFSGAVGGALNTIVGGIADIFDHPMSELMNFMNAYGKTIVAIGMGVIVGLANPYAGAAVYGYMSASLNGASFEESLRAAAISAATAYIMPTVSLKVGKAWAPLAQATTGGLISHAQGRNFSHGFWSAGIGSLFPTQAKNNQIHYGDLAKRALVGGVVARINNEKFENGAMSAAFSYTMTRYLNAVSTKKNVAHVGGLADKYTGAVKDYSDKMPNVEYFEWDEAGRLADWIDAHDGNVTIIAHSYGADTAAWVIAQGHQVNLLITLDPVSLISPDFQLVQSNTGMWINNYATGTDNNFWSDAAAKYGAAWGTDPGLHPAFRRSSQSGHTGIVHEYMNRRGSR